ncbi:MAG: LamG domain-containing protein, partial [Chloroflexi bacterium]|nr:LamG domain-containing protein [Chloroflexota bacterium]
MNYKFFCLGALLILLLSALTIAVSAAPALNFISPTAENGSTINVNSTQVNISITEQNLDTFKFNWNGTNYSIYDNSLVLAMNFNNNTAIGENATKFVDVSKYGNNGTCSESNCPTFNSSGKFGGAYQFDGTDDYVNTSIFLNSRKSFTLEGWAKTTDKTLQQGFYGSNDNGTNRDYVGLRSGNYWMGVGDTQKYTISATAITNNVWFHWSLVANGTTANYYLNGLLVDTTTYNGLGLQTLNSNLIGAINVNTGIVGYFNGSIDEVRIYNRSLSAQEVWVHYQSEFQKYNSTEYRFYANL